MNQGMSESKTVALKGNYWPTKVQEQLLDGVSLRWFWHGDGFRVIGRCNPRNTIRISPVVVIGVIQRFFGGQETARPGLKIMMPFPPLFLRWMRCCWVVDGVRHFGGDGWDGCIFYFFKWFEYMESKKISDFSSRMCDFNKWPSLGSCESS